MALALCVCCKLGENFKALSIISRLEGMEVCEANAPMGTDQPIGQFVALEQGDEKRPRYIEVISRLLSRELGVHWHDGHRVSVGHLGEHLQKPIEGFLRQVEGDGFG